MMKHYKTILEPARERQYETHTTCDLCGAKCASDENYYDDEVTIKRREGTNYPDCGWGTETDVDMCGKCFQEKLVPWLQSQGAEVVAREWDY
jgi:hypothetical protein